MYISIFSDEFFEDVYTALPKIASWGMEYVDFRAMIGGKPIEKLSVDELKKLRATLDSLGLKTGVIQSSLCKVHLPDQARRKAEEEKLGELSAPRIFSAQGSSGASTTGSINRTTLAAASSRCDPTRCPRYSICIRRLQSARRKPG